MEDWYKDAIFYEVFVRAFCDSNDDGVGDIPGLISKLDYIQALGANTIWLLPITPSPWRDGGYDVGDYFGVHPDYGTLDDFRALVAEAHHRDLRVVVELIPNHTSDQHPWFQASRDPRHPDHARYRDWYVWSPTDTRYAQARIIFRDTEPSNWTYEPLRGEFYWHRFYRHQPDLNYEHPAVQRAMLRVVQFWIDQGADGVRVDATPYLFEQEGTSCENLPATHAYFKRLRAFVDAYAPGTMLLSEANQWPEDVRAYFGADDEFHMNFHFPLMPRVFESLAQSSRQPIEWILARTPVIPPDCQWGTFLRNHDELTLEMVTPEERAFLWDYYAPDPRMRINLGIRRRLAPLLGNDPRRIQVAHSILLTLVGSPFLYYGDEIGMGDNIELDDRDGVRTPMQWDDSPNAGFSAAPAERLYAPVIAGSPSGYTQVNVAAQEADPGSLLRWVRSALALRRQHPAMGRGTLRLWPLDNLAILAYERRHEAERLFFLNNLSPKPQEVVWSAEDGERFVDLFSGEALAPAAAGLVGCDLPAYGYRWLRVDN